MTAETHADRFTELRPLLFTVAYEILGSATDADDVLQESYLRWADVDLATVLDTKSYLAKIVTRQALNALRSSSRRREQYIGPWLPEPILLDERDASDDMVLAESVSTAMLVVLESLGPDERAVFVLREVFGFAHDEIAEMIGRSAASVRQTAHRARAHVHARRPRFEPVDDARAAEVTEAFLAAASSGQVETLMAMLAPDVVFTADSDGKASAVRRPIRGALAVSRLLSGFTRVGTRYPDLRVEPAIVNSMPGMRVYFEGRLQGVFVIELSHGLIHNIFAIRNPDKLTGIETRRPIAR
ncbi:sigma-70 family RNA polymerase sigma factor [Gordonia sp. HNM0687]|uniref:Sigma-70 family RNA polymerase sigma factor n=1 Tax=Gordonia mangrovi TaxID=2665643 RepID=A0A6L7GNH0_9ACTN|nr:RNA polymerase sigma factor SigJ [Gordonia mangrovi]MXP21133.1 sigma-70 family RNA polymerase sigma factor [Gordonia mangrovi]UVF78329.1 RNA polymerase sigma factor SigJ [Gordonia mangrovi]